MAFIEDLYIENYRNIKQQLIKPSKKINIFIAKNAQGKTNFLESIYYLAHSKSFKTSQLTKLIPFDEKHLSISAKLDSSQIQIIRSKNQKKTLVNKIKINNISEITKILPVQIISIDKGFITFSDPKNKRSHLNWGVFHVEQNFLQLHLKYKKLVQQINNILITRNQTNDSNEILDIWFLKLTKVIIQINTIRKKYISELNDILNNYHSNTLKKFSFSLDTGLSKELDKVNEQQLFEYLKQQKQKLFKKGFLPFGCHRASINFKYKNKPIDIYSRGEQKTLSIIFSLLQVFHLKQNNINPILLIDDISSELDKQKIRVLMSFLRKLDIQIFLTSITPIDNLSKEDAIFSISQGIVSRETS
jgi:DNA replication and repair protein RecF